MQRQRKLGKISLNFLSFSSCLRNRRSTRFLRQKCNTTISRSTQSSLCIKSLSLSLSLVLSSSNKTSSHEIGSEIQDATWKGRRRRLSLLDGTTMIFATRDRRTAFRLKANRPVSRLQFCSADTKRSISGVQREWTCSEVYDFSGNEGAAKSKDRKGAGATGRLTHTDLWLVELVGDSAGPLP